MGDAARPGGRLVVDCLVEQGITTAFGVPGESYLDVLDGFHDQRDQIRYVSCRHEGGAAFMAEAWGKLTGQPGICFATRGPGAANATIGVHTAMQNSSPMILFVGQVDTTNRDREAFQEVDYRSMFGPLAKWATEITDADRIPETIARAFTTALGGRPGPVVVALPENMLASATNARPAGPVRVSQPSPSTDQVNEVAALLDRAVRPLVLIGGLIEEDTRDGLQEFAEANDLPVASGFRFHDSFDNHSPCYVGDAGLAMPAVVSEAITDADVILALGVRFDEVTTGAYRLFSAPTTQQTLIHSHASSEELGKIYQADLSIHAGTGQMVSALRELRLSSDPERRTALRGTRQMFLATLDTRPQPGELDMGEVMTWLQLNLGDDAIVTNGAGNFAIWPNKKLLYGRHQRLLAPQSGAMGYGFPAAISAKIARPDRTVVCFTGDGDFQMTCQELGSSAQAGAQPIVLVVDNGMYGTIRMHQERRFPGRVVGTEIVNPDFVTLAEAYGYHAERVARTADFPAAFARAKASPTGALLHLVVDPEMLTPNQSVTEARAPAG